MKNQDDRRARRSRRLMQDSFLDLLKEKQFREISAKDVTERADLNRATFYLHYKDTGELLAGIENEIIAGAQALVDAHLAEVSEQSSIAPILGPILDYIAEHRDTVHLLLQNSDASNIMSKLQQLILSNGDAPVRQIFSYEDEAQIQYFLSYISFGVGGLVKEWFDRDRDLPKERLIAYVDALITSAADLHP